MVERTRAPSNTIDALLLKAIFSALYGQAKRKTYAFTFAGARYEFRTDLLVHESAPALPKLSKRLLTEKEVKRDELLARRRTCEAVAQLEAQVAAIKRMPGLTRKERQDRRELLNALGLGNLMFLAEPTSENYMLSDKNLAEFQRSAGFCPVIDLCCDELGANARAPLSYDARADALCQGAHIEGKDLFCNPPFTKMLKFAKLLDDAHARDARTRAMLVIPYRKSLHWFYDHVLKKPHWRVAHCWPRGNDLFSGVARGGSDAFSTTRAKPMPSIEAILGLVMATQTAAEKAMSGLVSADHLMVAHTDVSELARLLQEVGQGRMRGAAVKLTGREYAFCGRCFGAFKAPAQLAAHGCAAGAADLSAGDTSGDEGGDLSAEDGSAQDGGTGGGPNEGSSARPIELD
jgi:hypothetical protein